MENHRSFCPLNLIVEILGDRWSLLILRDMMFEGKRNFRQLLQMEENIGSSVLTDRVNGLEQAGLMTRVQDPTHKQKITYSLTEKGIDLMPMIIEAMKWSVKYEAVDREKYKPAVDLVLAGPEAQRKLAQELLQKHVGKTVEELNEV
ncbi:winged helix-turn-helix transcriptional regulator [Mucilaginibacter celer]|uniref:Transcriptional regulator n=1 Tax=Mucilaginibacter celer TaxID=2305508 RepID=A0A494VL87_9SPHI|nr:helix-turn-helix domain-containing protein [Mucilaginibacter celer]AYL94291.1 transcriptional regulator [Mucilaginibacter celer]